MKSSASLLSTILLLVSVSGCGPYRIRYTMPSSPRSEFTTTKTHGHGLSPIGGGGFFFAMNPMLPCPVDYSGPVDVTEACPDGFHEISHYHTFGQNAGAAFLSWLVLINAYHESTIEFQHAGGASPSGGVTKGTLVSDSLAGELARR